ncbi:hypothetical protein J4E91_005226 [Alternaria rosae]|nr:hypothetical protein J4E91_005226 [Alternaria rosae]
MIYDICPDNEKSVRNPDMTKRTWVYQGTLGSKSWFDHSARQKRVKEIRAKKPTEAHRRQDAARKARLDIIVERKVKRASRSKAGLTAGAHEAFDLYRLEHDMYALPSKRVTDGKSNLDQGIFKSVNSTTKKGALEVDVRGNLVDGLPTLSYVDRALFSHTIPLLRHEERRFMDQMANYMYSLRQIVALYRIGHEAWKSLSAEYLRLCEAMGGEGSLESKFATLSDAELIEAVVEMLCRAIAYNLGYTGSYSRVGRDQTEWSQDVFEAFKYKGSHVMTAYQKEHTIVHVVSLYRKKVDKALRERLGGAYEEWESVSDDALIPEGVVL